jgi:hypothetical protein
MDTIARIYNSVIIQPLQRLYLFGPEFMQFGFWSGKTPSEICQSVTTYSESFWLANADQCEDIIEKKFLSFRVTVEVIVYFAILYQLAKNGSKICWGAFCTCQKNRNARSLLFALEDQAQPIILLPYNRQDHNHLSN